jgi:CheY-like chemotaxis protein
MIILVDDEADHRTVLKLALEKAGYTVREASNGREALALERLRGAKFLITDIFMPEGDGLELIDIFRREFPQTKIIVMSGGGKRVRQDYLESAKLLGVAATFQKPFRIEALLEKLRLLDR